MWATRSAKWRLGIAVLLGLAFITLTVVMPMSIDICSTDSTQTEDNSSQIGSTSGEHSEETESVQNCEPFQPTTAAILLSGFGILLLAGPFITALLPQDLEIKYGDFQIRRRAPAALLDQIEDQLADAPRPAAD